jgi:hypothetical protein
MGLNKRCQALRTTLLSAAKNLPGLPKTYPAALTPRHTWLTVPPIIYYQVNRQSYYNGGGHRWGLKYERKRGVAGG